MARRRRHTLGAPLALALLASVAACPAARTSPAPTSTSSGVARSAVPTPAVSLAQAPAPSASPAPSAVSTPPALAPLNEPTPYVTLPVPGYGDAVVSVPLGATTKRVVALALHGNFDRPEWQCEVWRRITHGEVFVLCPRGIPRRDVPKELDRWEWGSVAKTKAELVAALSALRARYPNHAEPGPIVFTGFSLGAILGARLIQDPDLEVGAAVLVEGGYQGWSPAKAKGLLPRLGRLLFACGQTECRNAYRSQLEALFQRAGVASSLVADVKGGHTYDDPVAALVQAEWPQVLASIKTQ